MFLNIRILKAVAIRVPLILLAVLLSGCEQRRSEPERVSIAVAMQPVSAPVFVAYDRGFFRSQGLEVTLLPFTSGRDALNAVLAGAADFSTVADTPFVFAALNKSKVYLLASIADSDRYMHIVARKDRGISRPEDLKGKRIGVTRGTNAQYFLDAFLTFYALPPDRVERVPLAPEKMADALKRGVIDAAVSWSPYSERQEQMLGRRAVVLENHHLYEMSWNIVAMQTYVKERPDTARKLLAALIRAQRFIEEHPVEAREITAGMVGSRADLSDFNFDIRLGQAQLLTLEQEARWAIDSGAAPGGKVPNFVDLIYFPALESLAPNSITIMHGADKKL